MGYLRIGYDDLLGNTRHQVAAIHRIVLRWIVQFGKCRAYVDLDHLCRTFADEHVVLPAHVVDDVHGKLITCHPDGLITHDTAESDYCNLRSATPDIDDHVAHGLLHIQTDTQRCSHGLMDEVALLGAGLLCRVENGALLHLGDARWDADHHGK